MPQAIRNTALTLAVATIGSAIVYARASYPGTTFSFVAFNAAFCLLITLIFPRPRSYAFGCFAALLALGFWMKMLVHRIVDYPFVEPVGDFIDSPEAWDRVLLWSATAALGAAVPRGVQLIISRRLRRAGGVHPAPDRDPPAWFVERRVLVWTASLAVLSAVAIINAHDSIYRIGIDTQTRLPRPLPLIIAWIVNLGGGLVMATLLHWDRRLTSRVDLIAWTAVIAEAIVSSATSISRAIYLLRMIPYSLAAGSVPRTRFSRRCAAAAILMFGGFAVSMLLVTAQRMDSYLEATRFTDDQGFEKPAAVGTVGSPPTATSGERATARQLATEPPRITAVDRKLYLFGYVRQAAKLTSDRWIGLEGLMAVSAEPDLGPDMLREAITDDPRRGYYTLFQRTARSPYLKLAALERYTFLTLPGIAGLCAYGGSGFYIFAGVLLAAALMMGIETLCLRLTGNPYLTALVALNLAYVVHQMNFPYLTFVYVCELLLSVLVIAWATRVPRHTAFKLKVTT